MGNNSHAPVQLRPYLYDTDRAQSFTTGARKRIEADAEFDQRVTRATSLAIAALGPTLDITSALIGVAVALHLADNEDAHSDLLVDKELSS